MSRRCAALAIVMSSLAQASVSAADGPPERPTEKIAVTPSTCGDLPWASEGWAELLRVELAADGTRAVMVPASEPTPADAPRVRLEPEVCNGSARSATLALEIGKERIERAVDLTQVEPRARARVLALAAAELIHSSRARLALAGTSASPPQELTVRVHVETTATREREPPVALNSFGVFVEGEGRVFAGGNAGLLGARGGARFPLLAWSVLVIDGGALAGAARDPLGDVDMTLASLGLGVLAVGGVREVSFGVGPRVEAGLASFTGHAFAPTTTTSSSVSSPLVVVSLSGTASFVIAGRWSGLVGLDAGTTLYSYGARADGRHVADLAGPMLGTRLGLMWTAP